jgi:hypothetical protein
MNSPREIPLMYVREHLLARIETRLADLESSLRRDHPEFELYLIAKSERGRRQIEEILRSVSEFQFWYFLRKLRFQVLPSSERSPDVA